MVAPSALILHGVTNELHREAAAAVDAWCGAWSVADDSARRAALARIAAPDVRMRDRFSCAEGIDEMTLHIAAARRFMPGLHLQRERDVRHCQGTALVDWTAVGPDNQRRGRGTNAFRLGPDGRIAGVTGGFWA